MNPEALTKLKEKLTAIEEAVTMNELKKAVEAMLAFSVKLQNKTEAELKTIAQSVDIAISRLEKSNEGVTIEGISKIQGQIDASMSSMMAEHEAMISEAQARIDAVKNGKDGKDGKNGKDGKDGKNGKDGKDGKEGPAGRVTSPSRGFFLKVGGAKKGITSEVNFVGSGVAYTEVNGVPTLTFTGGSGATAVETPTGTVNGVNLSFTVANTPLYIIVDGISRFETIHYTLSGLNVTLLADNQPSQYIRSVYSA